jgi:hypothetical protein
LSWLCSSFITRFTRWGSLVLGFVKRHDRACVRERALWGRITEISMSFLSLQAFFVVLKARIGHQQLASVF